jgi:hypothetical protein
MWLKPLFARTSKNAKSGLRKWLEVLPSCNSTKSQYPEIQSKHFAGASPALALVDGGDP